MYLMMLYLAVLIAGLAPQTAAGRALRRLMIDLPRAALAWFTPGRLLLLGGILLVVAAVAASRRGDLMAYAAQVLPEGIGWAVTFDVATYLDVIALAWLLAAAVRLRAAARVLRIWAARGQQRLVAWRASGRSHSTRRRVRKPASKSSDDDEGWTAAFGYA